MSYRYLSYNTCYSSKGDFDNEFVEGRVCFAPVFRFLEKNRGIVTNKYRIKIYKADNRHLSNFCSLNKNEIKSFISLAKSVLPTFHCLVKEYDGYFMVSISITGNCLQHKYILTWVRYLYEFPYNLLLSDAIKFREKYKLNNISLYNLINVVFRTANRSGCIVGSGHSMYYDGYGEVELPTNSELKDILNDKNKTSLNEAIAKKKLMLTKISSIDSFKEYKHYEEDYWKSEDEFNKRCEVYYRNLKSIIKVQ